MSVINTQPLIGSSGNQVTGYNLTNSLRFRASASAYLSRTPASTSDRQKFTFSFWCKRGTLGSTQRVVQSRDDGTAAGNNFTILFDSSDKIDIVEYSSAYRINLVTTQVFRDPSAWYHITLAIDTTQATDTNRVKLYVNGTQVTSFSTATYPSQNTSLYWNVASQPCSIGRYNDAGGSSLYFFDGYLSEFNFIDGQQLAISSVGEIDTTTGVWKPKRYTGTYGTNGFYLPFTDIATTSGSNAGLGKDFSGNGNYWTTNNISVTAGATYDSMTDVPTLTSATAANYAVLNPLKSYYAPTNGNLSVSTSASATGLSFASIELAVGSKYYFEATATGTAQQIGIFSANHALTPTGSKRYWYLESGGLYNDGTQVQSVSTFTSGDTIAVAWDGVAQTVTFYKNNTQQGTAISVDTSYSYFFGVGVYNGGWNVNFGQRPFAYTPPTGFKALNTYNLPDSTIVAGNKNFDVVTWTGNGTAGGNTQNITTGLNADFMWVKQRDATNSASHVLSDIVRGNLKVLCSNQTELENSANIDPLSYDGIQNLGTTSPQMYRGSSGTYNGTNGNGKTYVGWIWKANGAGVSNTNGSITSTVSVNASAGFSIVTWTAPSTTATHTVGHGLGVAPKMIITKSRSGTSGSGNWAVYHVNIGLNGGLVLNTTAASFSSSNYWSASNPTSTVFGLNDSPSSSGYDNNSGSMVAYCWAEIQGFSKFGSYTGNGSADGPFIYTGFKPKFLLVKNISSGTNDWAMFDSAREPYNQMIAGLKPNKADSEYSGYNYRDFLSNGFKLRNSDSDVNTNGSSYIYAAFAENPFKNSLAR